MMSQIYLVLISDGRLALTVGAALEDRLLRDGYRAMALVPTVRGPEFAGSACRRQLANWRTGSPSADSGPQVVALYEDGLLDSLASLGLPAYVGVQDGDGPRIIRWTEDAGAIMLPVGTSRDLVDAVADHTPWSRWAAGLRSAPRRHRQPGKGGSAVISRKVATMATVTGPLLLASGPVTAIALSGVSQASAVPSGAPASVILAADIQTAPPAGNGLEPTASWLERNTAPNGTLIMPDNQLAIHYPPDARVPNCENGCTKVFQWILPTQYPDPNANPPQINDRFSAVNWIYASDAEKEQLANFLVPPGTSYSTLREGLQQTIDPSGTILGGPDYVYGFSKGILLMPTAPDNIPMSSLPQDGTGLGQQPAPGAAAGFASGPSFDQLATPSATTYVPAGSRDTVLAGFPVHVPATEPPQEIIPFDDDPSGYPPNPDYRPPTPPPNQGPQPDPNTITPDGPLPSEPPPPQLPAEPIPNAAPQGSPSNKPDPIPPNAPYQQPPGPDEIPVSATVPSDTAADTAAPGAPSGTLPQAPSADAAPQAPQADAAAPQQQRSVAATQPESAPAPVAAAPQPPPVQTPTAASPQASAAPASGGSGSSPGGTTAVAPGVEAGVPGGPSGGPTTAGAPGIVTMAGDMSGGGPTTAGGSSGGGTTAVAFSGGASSGGATG